MSKLAAQTASLTCQITEDPFENARESIKNTLIHTYPCHALFGHIWANSDLLYFETILPSWFFIILKSGIDATMHELQFI
jgi:hypothetical protein